MKQVNKEKHYTTLQCDKHRYCGIPIHQSMSNTTLLKYRLAKFLTNLKSLPWSWLFLKMVVNIFNAGCGFWYSKGTKPSPQQAFYQQKKTKPP